jgi:hypothetical protein
VRNILSTYFLILLVPIRRTATLTIETEPTIGNKVSQSNVVDDVVVVVFETGVSKKMLIDLLVTYP